jgi:hypothetical protein
MWRLRSCVITRTNLLLAGGVRTWRWEWPRRDREWRMDPMCQMAHSMLECPGTKHKIGTILTLAIKYGTGLAISSQPYTTWTMSVLETGLGPISLTRNQTLQKQWACRCLERFGACFGGCFRRACTAVSVRAYKLAKQRDWSSETPTVTCTMQFQLQGQEEWSHQD